MEAAACAQPASAGPVYSRRQPEKTALFQVLQQHLLTFEQGWTDEVSGCSLPKFVTGRPCPRCRLLSYFLATSSRYQRKIVSGVAMVATTANPFRPNTFPSVANRLRSASVSRTRFVPSFSRRN